VPKKKKTDEKLYEKQFTGSILAAVRINQKLKDQFDTRKYETFTDSSGAPGEVKCPKCPARYLIGHKREYSARESFEKLKNQLEKILLVDHANYRSHGNAIPLTSFD
jgi:hypothetical protein